jgi:hypothetical protein
MRSSSMDDDLTSDCSRIARLARPRPTSSSLGGQARAFLSNQRPSRDRCVQTREGGTEPKMALLKTLLYCLNFSTQVQTVVSSNGTKKI